MNVAIKSDASTVSTRVFATETGEEIKGICAIDVSIRPDDMVKAAIVLWAGMVDVGAEAEFHVMNPSTGEPKAVKRIEFADGSAFDAK